MNQETKSEVPFSNELCLGGKIITNTPVSVTNFKRVDPTLARRSMELMAKEVMPILESA